MIKGRRNATYINFEYIATNVNAELDQSVGAFRCSVPGLYFFTFTALSPRNDHMKIALRKNRQSVTTVYASEKAHTSASGSATLWLKQNDIVYPFIEDGDFVESTANTRALTSFSGFKVYGRSRSEASNDPEGEDLLRDADSPEFFPVEPDANDKIEHLFKAGRPRA